MCRCGADGDIPTTAEHLETGTMQDAGLINKHDAGIVTGRSPWKESTRMCKACACACGMEHV